MIKVIVPNMALKVIGWAIAHGAGGVSQDFPLAQMFAGQRALRLAEGPDELHRHTIAKFALAQQFGRADNTEPAITRGR